MEWQNINISPCSGSLQNFPLSNMLILVFIVIPATVLQLSNSWANCLGYPGQKNKHAMQTEVHRSNRYLSGISSCPAAQS